MPKKGYKHSKETKKRMSKAQIGNKKGYKHGLWNTTIYSRYKHYKSRDKKYNRLNPVNYTLEEFRDRLQNSKCVYCGSTEDLGLDRIDNLKGHSKSNTVVCCSRCNIMRSNKFTVEEFKLIGKVINKIDKDRTRE